MNKKAIIYDLDNTLYTVASIGDKLFASLFELIEKEGIPGERMPRIKDDIMRKPFQVVARQHHFSNELTQKGVEHLQNLSFSEKIELHADYPEIKKLPQVRFLVTTGFTKLQHCKIRNMGIEHDFKEVHVVDPMSSNQTKRTVFTDIMQRHRYSPAEVLVVGDDPESEIQAATDLGIETVLYDKNNRYHEPTATYKIKDFSELGSLIFGEDSD